MQVKEMLRSSTQYRHESPGYYQELQLELGVVVSVAVMIKHLINAWSMDCDWRC
jgi:hypothetical protein